MPRKKTAIPKKEETASMEEQTTSSTSSNGTNAAEQQPPPLPPSEEQTTRQPEATPQSTTPIPVASQQTNGSHNVPPGPDMHWAVNSDRTTRIRVAAWINEFSNDKGETWEQVTLQISRRFFDAADGQWKAN